MSDSICPWPDVGQESPAEAAVQAVSTVGQRQS